MIKHDLVRGLERVFFLDFPYVGNVIIPTDELIFFRGVGQPPTSDGFKKQTGEKTKSFHTTYPLVI